MNNNKWIGRVLLAGLVCGGIATNAFAQDKSINEASSQRVDVANEQEANKSRTRLDEIIVTAQKREESIQDVPLSITHVSGDMIEEQQISALEDLSKFAANTKISNTAGKDYIYMRGLGSGGNRGFEQSVGVFLDGIHFGRTLFLAFGLSDVERIEVLRGPQGTLFGKNTIAGAINVLTRMPHDEWEFRGAARLGSRESRHFEAIVNAPILEDDLLNVRISGALSDTRGHVYNSYQDEYEGNADRQSIRGKFRSQLLDNLRVTAAGSYETFTSNGWGSQISYLPEEYRPLYESYDSNAESDHTDFHTTQNEDSSTDRTSHTASLTFDTDLPGHTLTMLTAYAGYDDELVFDADAGPAPLIDYWGKEKFWQFSNELRLTSEPGDLEYVAGLYSFKSNMDLNSYVRLVANATPQSLTPELVSFLDEFLPDIPINGEKGDVTVDADTTSVAAFGQATWRPFENLALIGGLRYSWENKRVDFQKGVEQSPVYHLLLRTDPVDVRAERSEGALSPKASVTWNWSEEIMTYFTYAQGFKAGGYNVAAGRPEDVEFDAENSTSLEAGVKTTWLGGAAIFNVGLFRTDFENLQLSSFNGATYSVSNAGGALSQGVEVDGMLALSENLLFTFSGAYLDAKFTDRKAGPCPSRPLWENPPGTDSGPCDLTGQPLPYAPEWQAALSGQYETPVFNWPILAGGGVAVMYQAGSYLSEDLDPLDYQEAYTRIDLSVGVRSDSDIWRLTGSVKNLTDEVVVVVSGDVAVLGGAHLAFVEPPRTFSVELRANF